VLNFLTLAALLSILAVTEGEAGPRSAHAASFLALLPLAALVGGLFPRGRPVRLLDGLALVGAVLFAAIFFREGGAVRFFALAASLGLAGARSDPRDPRVRTLPLAAFAFGLLLAIRDHLPFWSPSDDLAERVTARVASALGDVARWGPTRAGAWVALGDLALVAGTLAALGARARAAAALAALLSAAVVPGAVALELLGRRPFAASFPHPSAPLLALALSALPLAVLSHALARTAPPSPAPEAGTPPARRTRRRLAGLGVVALAGLLLLAFSRPFGAHPVRVLLDTRGRFGMEPLAWGRYGAEAEQGASLASLPPLLDAYRFPFARCDSTLDAARLAAADVLVVMNPTREYPPEEREAIWSFVRRGGGLLVLGDHTNIMGTGVALESLLAPAGIRVQFDSAIPLVERWTWYGCLRVHPHPALRGVRDETDVKISVGASLGLTRRAFPLITGRDAFSDAGDSTNARGAYLGNMRPDRSERWGDLVLAAEAPYGRGKVIVFGDTSTFQRSAVTHSRELVLRLLTYLGTPGHAAPGFPARAGGALLLAGAGAAFVAAAPGAGSVALLAGAATILLAGIDRVARVSLPEPDTRRVVWVDLAHGNRVDVHSGRDDGIGGLCDHFARHGLLPLSMKRFDARALQGSRAFVTVAPAFPFSTAERSALGRFVSDGGLLLVAAGYEESRGAAALLADFGLAIGATPLGAAPASKSDLAGTGVMMHESWPVEASAEDAAVLAEAWGYPLVVLRRVGRGSVLVIGDSSFLGDGMLEGPERANVTNIDFLRRALESALGTEGGGAS
jgi:hypothetical protein